jgi:hypothetical protein
MQSDLTQVEAGNANVANQIGTGSNVFALLTLGGAYSENGSGSLATYQSSVGILMSLPELQMQPLRIGLLNPVATGSGFDSLTLTIAISGGVLRSDTFTDLSAAVTFFSDNVLDFAAPPSGSSTSLTITLTVTASHVGDGFRSDIVAAAVPEPATSLLLIGSAAMLVLWRSSSARRRRPN